MFARTSLFIFWAGIFCLRAAAQSGDSLPPAPDPSLRQHAVVIGVNHYQVDSGWSSLAFPESDAARVGRLLKSFYGFETVTVLTGKDKTTRQHILSTLKEASESAGPNDGLLLFYAGHGYAVTEPTSPKRGGYWIPSDGERDPESWINVDMLLNYMLSSKARHVLLISDSCYAGSFFQRGLAVVEQGKAAAPDPGLYGRQARKPSRFILTSGDFEEVPDKSVFTAQFIHKLEGKRPIFSAEDVYYQVKDAVYDQTNNQVLAKEMLEDGAGGNFIFSQKKTPAKDALVILNVTPPLAKVAVTGAVHSASAVIVDPFDALVGEHRIRFEGAGSRTCRIQAPGYFSTDLAFRTRPGSRLEKTVALKEWKPKGMEPAPAPQGGVLTSTLNADPTDALEKKAALEKARWSSQKATAVKVEPEHGRMLMGVYDISTNPHGGRRNQRMTGSQVKILTVDGEPTEAAMLVCHAVEPKRKDERVGREVRDMMSVANNPSLISVLTGDFVFIFDSKNGTLLFREKLEDPIKKDGAGRLHLVQQADAPDRPLLVVSEGGAAIAAFTFTF